MGRPLGRDERAQRQARRVGAIGFVVAALLPVVLWHRVMADIASEFRFDLRYFVSECSPGRPHTRITRRGNSPWAANPPPPALSRKKWSVIHS